MHTIFVGGLREWHRQQHLEALLVEHGLAPGKVAVPLDRTGRGQRIAYIAFATRAEADAAIAELHGIEVAGGSLVVTNPSERRPPSSQYRHPPRRASL